MIEVWPCARIHPHEHERVGVQQADAVDDRAAVVVADHEDRLRGAGPRPVRERRVDRLAAERDVGGDLRDRADRERGDARPSCRARSASAPTARRRERARAPSALRHGRRRARRPAARCTRRAAPRPAAIAGGLSRRSVGHACEGIRAGAPPTFPPRRSCDRRFARAAAPTRRPAAAYGVAAAGGGDRPRDARQVGEREQQRVGAALAEAVRARRRRRAARRARGPAATGPCDAPRRARCRGP